jgi:hypothetical protein
MSKDIYDTEIRAIKEAYDALKCLDMTQTQRALAWLESRFHEKFAAPKHSPASGDSEHGR